LEGRKGLEMSKLDSRLRRLEEQGHRGCPECSGTASYVVVYGADTPSRTACLACGRPLVVLRLVYDEEAERLAP
jgi:hypothetical protein